MQPAVKSGSGKGRTTPNSWKLSQNPLHKIDKGPYLGYTYEK